MGGKFLWILLLSFSAFAESRPHSQRYLSIYATDVTESFADYDRAKNLMRSYMLAWQARDMKGLKKLTGPKLFGVLSNNPGSRQGFSIHPEMLEIQDLAIYKFNNNHYVQFDTFDAKLKKNYSGKSWFEISGEAETMKITAIHDHLDPDAGP
jgi:hypothetical protein